MVHLVTERPREAVLPVIWQNCRRLCARPSKYDLIRDKNPSAKPKTNMTFPVVYELIYLGNSVIFLIGSVLFLPSFGRVGVDIGCNLYIIGSVVMASLTGFDLVGDALNACGVGKSRESTNELGSDAMSPTGTNTTRSSPTPSRRRATIRNRIDSGESVKEVDIMDLDNEKLEKALYLVAAVIFTIGTFQWQHPRTSGKYMFSAGKEQVLGWAIFFFILGSALFVIASFLNALSLATKHLTFTKWALVTCSVYELGGILYVIGSVCFMPNQHCGEFMEVLGAWNFILGSVCYIIGGFVEFMKMVAMLFLQQQEEKAAHIISRAWRRRSQAGPPTNRRFSDRTESTGLADADSPPLTDRVGVETTEADEPENLDKEDCEVWNNHDPEPSEHGGSDAEPEVEVAEVKEELSPRNSPKVTDSSPTDVSTRADTEKDKEKSICSSAASVEEDSSRKDLLNRVAEIRAVVGEQEAGLRDTKLQLEALMRSLPGLVHTEAAEQQVSSPEDSRRQLGAAAAKLSASPCQRSERRNNTEELTKPRMNTDSQLNRRPSTVRRSRSDLEGSTQASVPQLHLTGIGGRHSDLTGTPRMPRHPQGGSSRGAPSGQAEGRRHTEDTGMARLRRTYSHEGHRTYSHQGYHHPGLVSTFVKAISAVHQESPSRGRSMESPRGVGSWPSRDQKRGLVREEGRPLVDVEMAQT